MFNDLNRAIRECSAARERAGNLFLSEGLTSRTNDAIYVWQNWQELVELLWLDVFNR